MSEIRESRTLRPSSVVTTSEERTVAAIAHASSLLPLLVSVGSGGLGGILFVFVPFLIYLSYKDRSRYVAFHAAQAFALQVIGSVGYFLLILVGALAIALVWGISILLVVILIGFVLMFVAGLFTVAMCTLWLGAPFVGMAFSVVGTVQAANGRDYRYPYIGDWVEDWLKRQESEAKPAV